MLYPLIGIILGLVLASISSTLSEILGKWLTVLLCVACTFILGAYIGTYAPHDQRNNVSYLSPHPISENTLIIYNQGDAWLFIDGKLRTIGSEKVHLNPKTEGVLIESERGCNSNFLTLSIWSLCDGSTEFKVEIPDESVTYSLE